jgi:glutamate formiminotransferase / 5-formyltetrahydrofolate cyclo-ligase
VLLESVPNVSEGRDPAIVEAIADAFSSGGARVLDTHLDADHHRAVVTIVGNDAQVEDGLVAGIDEARRRIDLRHHDGIHPRVGAADVVPVVPLGRDDLARAVAVATSVARRVGEELGVPVFLYGTIGNGRRPVFYRRGGLEALQARIDSDELSPAYGPRRLDSRSGAVLVGVRAPLVAFNLELDGNVEVAAQVAASVRESSGGLPGVQAIALVLGDGTVQVSTNLIDLTTTQPHEMVERIVLNATARGVQVGRGELVGLIPAASVAAAAAAVGVGDALGPSGVPTGDALEAAATALRLERLDPDRVLEWHLAGR